LKWVTTWLESAGAFAPWLFIGIFSPALPDDLAFGSHEQERHRRHGPGTLVMPYCSGMGNLIFAFILGRRAAPGSEIVTNALVNNVTNMTLLLGLPAILWRMSVLPRQKRQKEKTDQKEHKINRLSMLLTLTAPSSSPAPSGRLAAMARSIPGTGWF
jgi:cation:H+ antiporter